MHEMELDSTQFTPTHFLYRTNPNTALTLKVIHMHAAATDDGTLLDGCVCVGTRV